MTLNTLYVVKASRSEIVLDDQEKKDRKKFWDEFKIEKKIQDQRRKKKQNRKVVLLIYY